MCVYNNIILGFSCTLLREIYNYCLWFNSLMQGKKDLTVKDVENSFDGNICRCTGINIINYSGCGISYLNACNGLHICMQQNTD